jgi:hypothetical protein
VYIVIWNKQKKTFKVAVSLCSFVGAICCSLSNSYELLTLITNNFLIVQFCATISLISGLPPYYSSPLPPPKKNPYILLNLCWIHSLLRYVGVFSFPLNLFPTYLLKFLVSFLSHPITIASWLISLPLVPPPPNSSSTFPPCALLKTCFWLCHFIFFWVFILFYFIYFLIIYFFKVRETQIIYLNSKNFLATFFSQQLHLSLLCMVFCALTQSTFFPSFFFLYSFIHMCIHCLGHFSSLPSVPSLSPPPPLFQAEPVLPFSPILLKSRHKQ